MTGFSDILKRGRKIFDMKDTGGKWNRCEECGERRLCFDYSDCQNEIWVLCEQCTNTFVKEE